MTFDSFQAERVDSVRKPAESRGKVAEAETLFSGVSTNYGYPDSANPFVCVKLPPGMMYERKKSRSVSFVGSEKGVSLRGTTRSKDQAVSCMTSWAWEWWSSLSDDQKNSIRSAATKRAEARERSASAKRQRVKG